MNLYLCYYYFFNDHSQVDCGVKPAVQWMFAMRCPQKANSSSYSVKPFFFSLSSLLLFFVFYYQGSNSSPSLSHQGFFNLPLKFPILLIFHFLTFWGPYSSIFKGFTDKAIFFYLVPTALRFIYFHLLSHQPLKAGSHPKESRLAPSYLHFWPFFPFVPPLSY